MHEVDPFTSPLEQMETYQTEEGSGVVVAWEALRFYWVTYAPFQRRTRLGEARFSAWERVDLLHRRRSAVVYRHTLTLQERWNHPAMEQRVAERLAHLFPSSKLDWKQKIELFLEVQWQQQTSQLKDSSPTSGEDGQQRHWNLETCWQVFTQLGHPMTRRQHVEAVVKMLKGQFTSASSHTEGDIQDAEGLDESVVRAWLLYCTRKVDLGGWEELQDAEGQTFYYHEVDGITQWDPPQLQSKMALLLDKLGGDAKHRGTLSPDEQIARVFRQYDADESGEMTLDEFQHFYRALLGRGAGGFGSVSDAQVQQVFNVLDVSGDGAVSLEEFQLWWKTKLQLDAKETQEAATVSRDQQRRELCRGFLESADALQFVPARNTADKEKTEGQEEAQQEACFESNMLPRLVALLGEFPLRGLAYRRALTELVSDPMQQLVSLERFLEWYAVFEAAELEKQELERARQRAQAELRVQHQAQAAAREKQRRHRKQLRTLAAMTQQAEAVSEQDAQRQRQKKVATLFRTFDADGSGFLDEHELLQLVRALGHNLSETQVHRMMQVMDDSGDSRVSLDEFLAFWSTFENRRHAPSAVYHQGRRDAVAKPSTATEQAPHLTTSDAVASLAVSLEMAKDRVLKLTLADMRSFLGDWRDDLQDKRSDFQQHKREHDEVEAARRERLLHAFVPTKKRVYGAARLDITWIEQEVVECVSDLIVQIGRGIHPPLGPDAAQRLQAIGRGHVARQRVHALVCDRFQTHIDPHTQLFYFSDMHTGHIRLRRPVFPKDTSSVAPFEQDECASKAERYRFEKRLAELRAKKQFYDRVCLATNPPSPPREETGALFRDALSIDPAADVGVPVSIEAQGQTGVLDVAVGDAAISGESKTLAEVDAESVVKTESGTESARETKPEAGVEDAEEVQAVADVQAVPAADAADETKTVAATIDEPVGVEYKHRPLLAPSAFYMYDITALVQQRLLGNIWTALRAPQPELILIELIARRRGRQLMQRSSDAARNLPLHYAVRHPNIPIRTMRAFVNGYPEALEERDSFGMTPLHLAFREQRSSLELLELLAQRPPCSTTSRASLKARDLAVWTRQTLCGDTPLHVAIRHRASVGVLQWALSVACATAAGAGATAVITTLNNRGESAFHACITQQTQKQPQEWLDGNAFMSPRARTAVLLFLKHLSTVALCSTPTRDGDLPLHLAMDAFELTKQRRDQASGLLAAPCSVAKGATTDGWVWLVKQLITYFPAAVSFRKRSNGLLPVHLAVKYGFPEGLAVRIFELTVQELQRNVPEGEWSQERALLDATMIVESQTTLLHYTLLHQPKFTTLLSCLIHHMPTSCRVSAVPTGDVPAHVGAAAEGVHLDILRRICELHSEGCRTYNAKRQLPLHVAIAHSTAGDASTVDKVRLLLQHCQQEILADSEERRGLRALIMAANVKTPDFRVLLELLEITPSRKLTPSPSPFTARSRDNFMSKRQNHPVTPLLALSLRSCTPEITVRGAATACHQKFEELEDEDAYFLAMAKAKLRKQHYNPTSRWSFVKILQLVERNPLDEAVIQRALLATNEKLQAMIDAEWQRIEAQESNQTAHHAAEDQHPGYADVVETVTLDGDLLLVRTVHQLMFEFPDNPRLQLLGQAVLSKLLPSAFARAAYKAKVDPYFNL